jgi:hypothetical protein
MGEGEDSLGTAALVIASIFGQIWTVFVWIIAGGGGVSRRQVR